MKIRRLISITAASLLCMATGCGSSSDSSSTTASTSTDSPTRLISSDVAAGMTASPTGQTSTAAASISKSIDGVSEAASATPPAPATQQAAFDKLLSPSDKSACKITLAFDKQPFEAKCYGPSLNYSMHPDGSDNTPPQLPSGDLGFWQENDPVTGEACAAAKLTDLMAHILTDAKMAVQLQAAILCRSNIDGLKLPDKGGTTDATKSAQAVIDDSGLPMKVTAVTLSRAATDSDSTPTYTSSLSGTVTFSGPAGSVSDSVVATLKSIWASAADFSAGKAATKGRISLKLNRAKSGFQAFESLGNCTGADGTTHALSITYDKSSSSAVTYAATSAEFCGVNADPFDKNGDVDLTKKKSGSLAQGWGNNANRAVFNAGVDSKGNLDGTGNFLFAWQAGVNDGAARILEAKNQTTSGVLTGCGYFGFGADIASGGSITKMICNWAGPGSSHTGVTKAQKQCYTQSGGKMVSTSSTLAITYAPTNSCSKTVAQGFSYQTADPTNIISVASTAAVTSNLIDVSAIDVTVPTAPSVP